MASPRLHDPEQEQVQLTQKAAAFCVNCVCVCVLVKFEMDTLYFPEGATQYDTMTQKVNSGLNTVTLGIISSPPRKKRRKKVTQISKYIDAYMHDWKNIVNFSLTGNSKEQKI